MTNNKNTNYKILKKQASFYNKNAKLFLDFESEFGINPWFLCHFRTYFSIRNNSNKNLKGEINSGFRVFNLLKYLLFFIRTAVKFRKGTNSNSKICLISSAHLKSGMHTGRLGRQSFNLFRVEIPSFKTFRYKKINSKLNSNEVACENSNAILLKASISYKSIRQTLRFKKALNQLLKELELFNSEDDFFLLAIKQIKSSLILNYLEFLGYQKLFKKNAFKSVIVYDENSPSKRVIWQAAKSEGIKTYAIQHGAIHDLNPAYNYTYYNEKPILCDYTFLWGDYYTSKLEEYGYFKDSLVVTGAINNDIIDFDEISRLKANWTREYNPKSKTVVCYCSQPQKDELLRKKQLLDVLNVISSKEEYLLLIRTHPAEEESYFYNEIKKLNLDESKVLVDKKSPLEVHFQVSSSLITSFSTVGIEYAKYYKPIVVLDYLEEDLLDYIKSGVGFPVRSKEDLINLFEKDFSLDLNKSNYDMFLSDFYKKPNGMVTEEILNFISTQDI